MRLGHAVTLARLAPGAFEHGLARPRHDHGPREGVDRDETVQVLLEERGDLAVG